MTNNSQGYNQYKKKSHVFRNFIILIVVAAIIVIATPHIKNFAHNVHTVNNLNTGNVPSVAVPTVAEKKASDIEKRTQEVKDRADFITKVQKFADTEAQRIATDEYEKEENAKYEAVKAEIEKSKEEVRQKQVSF